MKKNVLPVLLILTSASIAFAAGVKPVTVVRYYGEENSISNEWTLPWQKSGCLEGPDGARWKIDVESTKESGAPKSQDATITFTLEKGQAHRVVVGCGFLLPHWSTNDYVLFPAAVYNGNQFDIKEMSYPPLWRDPSEFRADMPTTLRPAPHLGGANHSNAIRLNSGDVTVPLIGIRDSAARKGYIVLTTQRTPLGNNGLEIKVDGQGCRLYVTAPSMRGKNDAPADFKEGDSVVLTVRFYTFPAADIQALFDAVAPVRGLLNPSERKDVLSFSAAFDLVQNLYSAERWDEDQSFFWLSNRRPGKGPNMVWQLGWVGGGQITLGLLEAGNPLMQERSLKNVDMIFRRTQAPSGFFYAIGDGERFYSDGFSRLHPHNMTMVRKQADWLYCALKHFLIMEAQGRTVPPEWKNGARKEAEAFLRLWDASHQFGEFVDVETGRLQVGQSCAGALAPGALALAARYFHEPRYLKIAQLAAEQYDQRYVRNGLTTGGPGDILSAPDSESAFAMLESFVVLYETTGRHQWLAAARRMAAQCATWVVSYDYEFPPLSEMARIGAHSRGAVWASVSNRHGAPGICTLSGDSLLRLWRASGDDFALKLIEDIAHGITQYVSRPDRPVGKMPPGGICERVNLSDWEGKSNIGGNIFASCSWCESALALTCTEIPGLYVQPDTGFFCVFDNIQAERVARSGGHVTLRLVNPTKYPAAVTVLSETSRQAKKPLPRPALNPAKRILLEAGETRTETF